jgi:hypothetical protein
MKLLNWGIQRANNLGVPIKTETTHDNITFYLKAGFDIIGDWEVEGFRQASASSLHLLQMDTKDT